MNRRIEQKLKLLTSNAQTLRADGRLRWTAWEQRFSAAAFWALEDRAVDSQAIGDCFDLVKSSVGPLSKLRGSMSLILAAKLALTTDPPRYLEGTIAAFNQLKGAKFGASDHSLIAAHLIALRTEPAAYPHAVERTRAFYNGLKANHSLLTDKDDLIFAALLALSDVDVQLGVNRIEEIFTQLRESFGTNGGTLLLAETLTLGGAGSEAVNRALALREAVRAAKVRVDKSPTTPLLGVFALLPVAPEVVANDIAEARDFLKTQRGFGALSMDGTERLGLAAAMVLDAYAGKDPIVAPALAAVIAGVIAAQALVILTTIMATNAATAASS